MHINMESLKKYLDEHIPNYGDDDIHSIVECIYWHYAENNPIHYSTIKECFAQMKDILTKLTFCEYDGIISTVCKLCAEHEKEAFVAGLQTGIRLITELLED